MVKFLVIRFASPGEIRLSEKLVSRLDTEVEDAEVHFLTLSKNVHLLKDNPHIHRVHTLDGNRREGLRAMRRESFDYIIDLQNNLQSARIKMQLKRMDFTIKHSAFGRKKDLQARYLDTIRLFVEN